MDATYRKEQEDGKMHLHLLSKSFICKTLHIFYFGTQNYRNKCAFIHNLYERKQASVCLSVCAPLPPSFELFRKISYCTSGCCFLIQVVTISRYVLTWFIFNSSRFFYASSKSLHGIELSNSKKILFQSNANDEVT